MSRTISDGAMRRLFAEMTADDLAAAAPHLQKVWWEKARDANNPYTAASMFRVYERAGLHVTFPHFYSPVPEVEKVPGYVWGGPWMLDAMKTAQWDDQDAVMAEILRYAGELADVPRESAAQSGWDSGLDICWHNGSFPPLDAIS